MKKISFLLCLLFPLLSQAQNVEQDIDAQVWKPFAAAYNTFNTDKFMSLHSPELVRVSHDEKMVLSFSDYKKKIARENQFNKNYNIKATIELRFTERIHTAALAHESGVYKLNVVENTGKKATVYGKFEVTLRKENGVWKILVDSDRSGEGVVDEKAFAAASPLK